MRWGVRKEDYRSADSAGRKAIRKEFRKNVKGEVKRYRSNKGPQQDAFFMKNASNSAARSYFRADTTNNLRDYRDHLKVQNTKESRLSKDQINNGRYRVARARQIKRNVLSTAGGLALGGLTAAMTGGSSIMLPLLASGIGTMSMRKATNVKYYKQEKNMYGKERALQTTSNKKPQKR